MRFEDLDPSDPRLIRDALPVLEQLRTGLTAGRLHEIYAEGYPQGLRFTAAYEGEECVAVAGWRMVATTVVTRKLYVDDLVTAAAHRSRGIGAAMLAELGRRAAELGAHAFELDSGMARSRAHRFYVTNGMAITSLHFARAVGQSS